MFHLAQLGSGHFTGFWAGDLQSTHQRTLLRPASCSELCGTFMMKCQQFWLPLSSLCPASAPAPTLLQNTSFSVPTELSCKLIVLISHKGHGCHLSFLLSYLTLSSGLETPKGTFLIFKGRQWEGRPGCLTQASLGHGKVCESRGGRLATVWWQPSLSSRVSPWSIEFLLILFCYFHRLNIGSRGVLTKETGVA